MWRWLRALLALGLLVAALLAIPILKTEFGCLGATAPAGTTHTPILPLAHRRNEVNTYLTYPEWAIVHAYEDFAGVVRERSESHFNYALSVQNYWTSLCGLMGIASQRGTITSDYKAMLYIIGASFTAEFAVKGIYEQTIGRVTEWLRGDVRTPEDEFALKVATDYAKFLKQTPWYEYPFSATLRQFWLETPWRSTSIIRSVERRVALSLEFGVKAVYAKAIGALAGLTPADSKIRSIVSGMDSTDAATDPRIKLIEKSADGATIIETDRYRVFTEVLQGLAARQRDLVEIAGNDDVLITYLSRSDAPPLEAAGARLLTVPVQSRSGWERRGADVKVTALLALMRAASAAGTLYEFEHVYDY